MLIVAILAICYVVASWQGHIHLTSDHEENNPCFLCQFHSSAGVPIQPAKHLLPEIHPIIAQSFSSQITYSILYAFAIRAPPSITC